MLLAEVVEEVSINKRIYANTGYLKVKKYLTYALKWYWYTGNIMRECEQISIRYLNMHQ